LSWRAAGRALEFSVQAIVDFLIEDRCVVCGGSQPSHNLAGSANEVLDTQAGFGSSLLGGTRRRFFGPLAIKNQPVCPRCVAGFEPARWPGLLGTSPGRGIVVTVSGQWFGTTKRRGRKSLSGRPFGAAGDVRVIAPFMTNDNALKLVHLVKFSGYVELTSLMGSAMAAAYRVHERETDRHAVIVPVPMRRAEKKIRGFNQSERLAAVAGRALNLPVVLGALAKSAKTIRQSVTPNDRRAGNVRGVFRCRRVSDLQNASVLLVDDLVTSGSTAGSCAAELLAAGAGSVDVACFARAL